MLITLLLTMLYAKLRGMKIKPLLSAYDLYPIYLFELFDVFLQINIFLHNYSYTQWADIIKSLYLFLFLIPILYRKLYTPGIAGSMFIFAGTILNKIVIWANGGKMPIYPTLSKITGYYNDDMFQKFAGIHILGTSTSNLKFLADYIDVGYSILSPGDILIHFFAAIILYYTIKSFRENKICHSIK